MKNKRGDERIVCGWGGGGGGGGGGGSVFACKRALVHLSAFPPAWFVLFFLHVFFPLWSVWREGTSADNVVFFSLWIDHWLWRRPRFSVWIASFLCHTLCLSSVEFWSSARWAAMFLPGLLDRGSPEAPSIALHSAPRYNIKLQWKILTNCFNTLRIHTMWAHCTQRFSTFFLWLT